MIAIETTDCHPADGDYLLTGGAIYQLWECWQVWAAALRLLWQQWAGAFALFVAGVALADQRERKSEIPAWTLRNSISRAA